MRGFSLGEGVSWWSPWFWAANGNETGAQPYKEMPKIGYKSSDLLKKSKLPPPPYSNEIYL